jgi:shikimate dehydrogenase
MHEAAFAHCGMDADYALINVAPEALEDFLKKTVQEKKLKGFNVTVPHKESVVEFLDGSTSYGVMMNRAVNTVRVEPDGALSGSNTDGPGFARDLKERGVDVTGKKVALIGAGGGAKSVATTLAAHGISSLVIFDLDPRKTEGLCEIIREYFSSVKVSGVSHAGELGLADASVLVNATPVGMRPSDPQCIAREWLHPGLFVYDLIYNPPETSLLAAARAAGCPCANGLGMLLYQGCLAFEYWTGKSAPVAVMRSALEAKIRNSIG